VTGKISKVRLHKESDFAKRTPAFFLLSVMDTSIPDAKSHN